MMARDIAIVIGYDESHTCSTCGKLGAIDIMGDLICSGCLMERNDMGFDLDLLIDYKVVRVATRTDAIRPTQHFELLMLLENGLGISIGVLDEEHLSIEEMSTTRLNDVFGEVYEQPVSDKEQSHQEVVS